jgi:hypothetical protein
VGAGQVCGRPARSLLRALAALLGVYPTVARSLREGVQYVAGFLLGAALAIPVGMLLGPGIAGIAIVVVAGVLVSGWHRLGDQSPQVTFTALFALLLGGHQPVHYVSPDGRCRHRRGDRAGGQCRGVPAAAASPGRACDQAMG